MNKIKVYIDPSTRVLYSSYYIEGLYSVFGHSNVKFSNKYFKNLNRKSDSNSYEHYMPFVINNNNEVKKYIIDFRDKPSIKKNAYEWCDVYAKINFSKDLTDYYDTKKVISIPPGFGIKIWNFYKTAYLCISNYLKSDFGQVVSLKNHISDYYNQYKRPLLINYTSAPKNINQNAFVFLIGTLWTHDNCREGTNLFRKTFVETCLKEKINFEGGFFATKGHPQFEEFKHLIFTKRYSVQDYVFKTKQSLFVFNTPAVHDCHGWKLGEYLAMGKAIISTPISNELPEDFIHGINIHVVESSYELCESIKLLIKDEDYRKKLEYESKKYFNTFASPKAVIELVTRAKIIS